MKNKQFWIFFDGKQFEAFDSLKDLQEFHTSADYHVIEYSAYEQAIQQRDAAEEDYGKLGDLYDKRCEEIERLKGALREIRALNQKFAEDACMDWDGVQDIAASALNESNIE